MLKGSGLCGFTQPELRSDVRFCNEEWQGARKKLILNVRPGALGAVP